ncbi:hypothetical protein H0H81_007909 [Sphagnurus paluster]|uniref:RRM domain-containing protein n=1 Tax=Sphagnurus paluster TaxID=117069 RepID=A0A9P7K8P8_9AGAR|nr:hypothetical protein H0H81_007909 [Sphagnurus paluster]
MRVNWSQTPEIKIEEGQRIEISRTNKVRPPMQQRKRVGIPQHKRGDKHLAIQEAKKRVTVKTNLDKRDSKLRRNYPFIYVGNLKSSITAERLRSLFASCGRIFNVSIRCSRGQAVTVGVPVPEDLLTTRDRQYASVEFCDLEGAKLALRMNGKLVDGLEIVVCSSPADLPEVQDIVNTRLANAEEKKGLGGQVRAVPKPR